MREWNLKKGDPLSLTLAADARLGPTDYCNDHIWEVTLGGSEPPSLAIQTSFGLRARSLRMFPRFTESDLPRSDPDGFAVSPSIRHFAPNYLMVVFSPFTGIEVEGEYWVPASQAVAGRLAITNHSSTQRQLKFEWVALLAPGKDGYRMEPAVIGNVPMLAGKSDTLSPVVLLTGTSQAASGPFPAMTQSLTLAPNQTHHLTWVQAALETKEASFALARKIAAHSWEAERARLDMLNTGLVEIYTGNPDWDAAFAFTQKTAHALFHSPTSHLPYPSFTISRQPDNGFSIRGDGLDYNHLWSGQTPWDTWYMSSLLLPSSPVLLKGLLKNFLHTASENGWIDSKPGLAGQRSKMLAAPLLAALAEKVYQQTGDDAFIKESLPTLLNFFLVWFSPDQDHDGDGIPEWSHPLQTGYEDNPIFSYWHSWGQGIDISTAESPALCALLFNECQALIRLARHFHYSEPLTSLLAISDNLRTAVEIAWDADTSIYRYWDRDSHFSAPSQKLAEIHGSGRMDLRLSFDQPVRPLLRIQTKNSPTPRVQIFIHGTGAKGQHLVERIQADRFQWYLELGSTTSTRLYKQVEFLVVEGLGENDHLTVTTAGFSRQDHTLLLPLWAGIPAKERVQALVERTISDVSRFWRPHGIPACPELYLPEDARQLCLNVHLPWNDMIGHGLLHYGYRRQAAQLVSHLMEGVVSVLKRERCFRRYYNADTGKGSGEANALAGLAPLGLFLNTLGVHVYTPWRVSLSGFNPFPWPITVKYRGLTVLSQMDRTTVIFPDGQTTTVTDPAPCVVSME